MKGGGSAIAVLAAAAAIAVSVTLGACGDGEQGQDAAAAPLRSDGRQPANALIVLDVSRGMAEDDRLERAREGLDDFFGDLPADDAVGLATYSDRFRPIVPIAAARENRERLRVALESLEPAGGSAVNDAALEAYGILRELAAPERIETVVLIAHAADSGSAASADRVAKLLGAQERASTRVKVITIAYDTEGATRDAVGAFARASGGKAYGSGPEELEDVLRRAWSGL